MRTEHLDNKINELEILRSRGELTYIGGEMLSEFNEIKQALTIPVVTQRSELCEGNCGMNYCDENGCVDNKPDVGEPKPPEHYG